MIWGLLIGVVVGFAAGAFFVLRKQTRWMRSLDPGDQKYLHELMNPEERWKENAAHDIHMSAQ